MHSAKLPELSSPGIRQRAGARVWIALFLPPILLSLIIAAFYTSLSAQPGLPHATEYQINRALPYLLALNHTLLFLLVVWLIHRDGLNLKAIGWRLPEGRRFWVEIAVGIAAGVFLYLADQHGFTAAIKFVFTKLHWPSGSEQDATTYTAAPLAVWLLVVTVFPAVEETIYRGYALTRLNPRFGVVPGVLIASFFFGALHFGEGLDGMLSAAVYGVLVSVLFLWRRSLIAPTLAHSLANAIDFLRTIHHGH